MRPTHPEESSAFAYGTRLLATLALTLALIALAGYLLLEDAISRRQLGASQLHHLRLLLGLIALFAPVAGAAAFYILGGARLVREHRLVLEMATRDRLTGLPNRRAFRDEFPDAVAAAARHREPLALILADVDGLALINRRHGHEQGDTVLRVVSAVIRSSRPGDRAYRLGGEHFAMVLAHTDAEGARTLARRLARDFAEVGVEVSLGASALRLGMEAETLRAEADTALFEARRRGGNRTVHFEDIQALVSLTDAVLAPAVAPAAGSEV